MRISFIKRQNNETRIHFDIIRESKTLKICCSFHSFPLHSFIHSFNSISQKLPVNLSNRTFTQNPGLSHYFILYSQQLTLQSKKTRNRQSLTKNDITRYLHIIIISQYLWLSLFVPFVHMFLYKTQIQKKHNFCSK